MTPDTKATLYELFSAVMAGADPEKTGKAITEAILKETETLLAPVREQIARLERERDEAWAKVESLLLLTSHGDVEGFDDCEAGECLYCGVRDCPHAEPLHYHHDGCPACGEVPS